MTTAVLVEYIDQHRARFGVEPICTVLRKAGMQIAPSTYYAAKSRPPSARAVADAQRLEVIRQVHTDNYGVYGVRKMHAELNRRGHRIARCTVHRLMRAEGLRGISRAKGPRTTIPGTGPDARPDLLDRDFRAPAPNRVWVADITYCRTFAGWVYAAFVIDVYSRRVVGWQLSKSLRTDLALDALEMGLWTREHAGQDTTGVIAHSDKGVQYLAVRYTQRLAEAGAVASVGSTGDSYDNALAEAFNSLFKAELIRNKGPWKNIDDLEIAVAEYIDWFNHRRLHGEIGLVPPVEFEEEHYRHNPAPTTVDASLQSLH
ncbi:putative transposase [Nocardioides salarius]|uniref:Transposase n=1 Tax=Nocardioides salarius TaxID=374513 RepID=A0ABS2M7L2_9ACTN|nr:putative transposase [Nocardioides salarius]MBM7509107.1 putative transposase [Nocardioides salarius]